jgi:two-component system nitrogen regulation response regulator GlnG
MEVKILKPDALALLVTLDWRGNVRQLENMCRWLTVMASGREIHLHDLPPELLVSSEKTSLGDEWQHLLRQEIEQHLRNQTAEIAKHIIPEVERVLIKAALDFTGNKRHEAAVLLGYGRNTLTRKVNELSIDVMD